MATENGLEEHVESLEAELKQLRNDNSALVNECARRAEMLVGLYEERDQLRDLVLQLRTEIANHSEQ